MAIPSDSVEKILNIFNGLHSRLQFTAEIGEELLNFLDVTIIKNKNYLEFNWYHKPTFLERYLNYLSQHPVSQKRGIIIGQVDRALLFSHPRFQRENLIFIINVLLNNDYSLKFIFDTINTRLRYMTYYTQKKTDKKQ